MGAVADAVSSVTETVSDAVSSVGDVVQETGQAVIDEVVTPVVESVQKTYDAFEEDPIGTTVKVAAAASGNPALIMAANTAVAVAHGAELDDALESGAKAGATAWAVQGIAKAVSTPEVGGVTGPDNIDVGGGFNPATGASSPVVPIPPKITTEGRIAGNTAGNIIRGQDPLTALMNGGISAGTSAVTSQIDEFKNLPPAAKDAVNKVIATTLQGGDPSQALVDSAISAGIAEAKAQYKASETVSPPSGTQVASTDDTLPTVSVSGSPIYAESSKADSVMAPFGYSLMPASMSDQKPEGAYYDAYQNAWFAPNKQASDLQALLQEQPMPEVTPIKDPFVANPEPLETVNNGDGTVTQYMSDDSVRAIDLNTGAVTPVAPAPTVSSDVPTIDFGVVDVAGKKDPYTGDIQMDLSGTPTSSSDMGEIVVTDKKDPYTGDIEMDLSGVPVTTPVATPTVTPTAPSPTTAPLSSFPNLTSAQQSTLQKLAQPATDATSTGSSLISSAVPTFLTSKQVKSDFQDPLSAMYRLQNPSVANENTTNLTPLSTMNSPFYNYGKSQSIDDVLGLTMASGGLATPLMASGGMTGTRHGQYAHGGLSTAVIPHGGKMRVDFRSGDAVTGEGDGQSDDIPAMLADGEFVFPADVVAAIGNGSTKAGSDKLYDMMHGIRAHVRSAKPKDLPPEIKSPLDFLKTKRKQARS